MTDSNPVALPGGDATPLDMKAIQEREAAATKGPWRSMKAGNCTMENGLLAHIAEVEGLPRPWNPVWVGWQSANNFFKTFLREEDADFIAHARQDVPALIAQLTLARQQVKEAEALREYDAERLIGLAGRNAELRAEVTALQQERDELKARKI